MFKVGVVLALIGLALCSPPVVRTRKEIESFRNFLERTRTENGVRLPKQLLASSKASAWENSGKFEGDIVLDDWQVEAMIQNFAAGRNAYIWPNTKWPEDTIVYEFVEGEFDAAQREAIMNGIRDIEANSCVKFRERLPGEFNYVRLTGTTNGCYASVGYWFDRGPHTLNLGRNSPGVGCFVHGTIVHEILHVIGFFHMHSTHNRDDYVRIEWDNMWFGVEHNFDSYGPHITDNMGLPYEYTSIMHYGPYAFSMNGRPTIVALRSFEGEMGQQERVTDYDWLRLRRHYNCPGGWSKDSIVIESESENEKVIVVENAEQPYKFV
ncbi:zinc metalloproteinase nas-4-like [Battus philenor]|uniref:zinc metalloproteinase nas-4-like n=1 Tax=Battus philenor TaxID=42288 RepID=UPI0035CE8F49